MAYRILSLDGGGTWALLQAMALKDLYGDKPGLEILADFDMAVANSGGSIVLAGLIEDLTPSQICALFTDKAKRTSIFVKNKKVLRLSRIFGAERYNAEAKLEGLNAVFRSAGTSAMSALDARLPPGPRGETVRVLITAFDYDRQRAEFFRTFTTGLGADPSGTPLAEAVHASSNAPVLYFNKPALVRDSIGRPAVTRRYWDGAIAGYNNPVLAGVVEALELHWPPGELEVRSIGTGNTRLAPPENRGGAPDELVEPRKKPDFVADVMKLAGSINDDPPDAASFTTYFALGQHPPPAVPGAPPPDGGRVVRLNLMVQPVWDKDGDTWTTFGSLSLHDFSHVAAMDMDVLGDDDVAWIEALGDLWIAGAAPNQPIRAKSATLECTLGDPTYPGAKARW